MYCTNVTEHTQPKNKSLTPIFSAEFRNSISTKHATRVCCWAHINYIHLFALL